MGLPTWGAIVRLVMGRAASGRRPGGHGRMISSSPSAVIGTSLQKVAGMVDRCPAICWGHRRGRQRPWSVRWREGCCRLRCRGGGRTAGSPHGKYCGGAGRTVTAFRPGSSAPWRATRSCPASGRGGLSVLHVRLRPARAGCRFARQQRHISRSRQAALAALVRRSGMRFVPDQLRFSGHRFEAEAHRWRIGRAHEQQAPRGRGAHSLAGLRAVRTARSRDSSASPSDGDPGRPVRLELA